MLPVTATYYNNQTSSTSTLLCASSLLSSSSNTHYFLCNPSIRECLKHGQHGTRKCAKILEKNLGYLNWPRGSKLLTAKCEHPSIWEQMHANVSYLFISHKNPKLCWIVSFWSLKIVKLTTHAAWPQENMAQGNGDDLLKQKPKLCPSPAMSSDFLILLRELGLADHGHQHLVQQQGKEQFHHEHDHSHPKQTICLGHAELWWTQRPLNDSAKQSE